MVKGTAKFSSYFVVFRKIDVEESVVVEVGDDIDVASEVLELSSSLQ